MYYDAKLPKSAFGLVTSDGPLEKITGGQEQCS